MMTVEKENRKRATLRRMLEPIRDILTPDVARAMADLRADSETQARIEELAERHHESQLSGEELAEYQDLVNAADVIAVLQANARSVVARQAS